MEMQKEAASRRPPRPRLSAGDARRPGLFAVILIELRCALATLVLLGKGMIGMPTQEVGRAVRFADGSTSVVYRETRMRTAPGVDRVILAVRFRLRFLGTNRIGHALFRFESLFNTLLFAAHEGFGTKLWMTDPTTGFYRGIYEWEGAGAAARYSEVLRVVLAPWVEPGRFDYRVIECPDRETFFAGQIEAEARLDPGDLWWLPLGTGASVPRVTPRNQGRP